MKKVLVASKSCGTGLGKEEICRLFKLNGIDADMMKLSEAKDRLNQYDGIVIGMDDFSKEEFERAVNLKVIMKYGVGIENIDAAAAAEHNVKIANMPGINNEAVAEMAFALMLCAARRVAEGDRMVRNGAWPRLMGTSLKGKTLGIVGTGAIGRMTAEYSTGFKMRLLGYDPFPNKAFSDMGGKYVSFEEILRESDFISIHVPLLDSTYHMFNDEAFKQMKPASVLINTARGAVVDENALKRALDEGLIAGAGIDVFEYEPAVDSPLIGTDRIVTTPHIAASSIETMKKMDNVCVTTMTELLSGIDK